MVVDVAKTIEKEVVSIHQIMKEQGKNHILKEIMEDDTTQGKMKGEGMISPEFNVIIVKKNIVIMLMNV